MVNRGGQANHLGLKATVNENFSEVVACVPRLIE